MQGPAKVLTSLFGDKVLLDVHVDGADAPLALGAVDDLGDVVDQVLGQVLVDYQNDAAAEGDDIPVMAFVDVLGQGVDGIAELLGQLLGRLFADIQEADGA